ncbi:MAG: YkgJ family cysteine cluster protein [Polyangiaceae bacterium]|nr:YkgJ family cysteine cluster protein [Polyangiaceae bacterium]
MAAPQEASAHRFRCTACGECCRKMRVVLTLGDLVRLCRAVPGWAQHLAWLAPDEVDMTNEPGSFVELSVGRRLMTLAWKDGGCGFLKADGRCAVYVERPMDCRIYPYDFSLKPVGLLPLFDECEAAWDTDADLTSAETEDTERWRELAEYQALVGEWNRRARQRRRLGYKKGEVAEFLRFLAKRAGGALEGFDAGFAEAHDSVFGEKPEPSAT